MDERSIERLLTRFAEGKLTDGEHCQLLELLRIDANHPIIEKILYQNQLLYVQSSREVIWASLTEAEQQSAKQRSDRTLKNILPGPVA